MISSDYLSNPVLVIEDQPLLNWAMIDMLEGLGFTDVHGLGCAEEALDLVPKLNPRLIVSDVDLGPNAMRGTEAVLKLRLSHRMPVLFVTGCDDPQTADDIRMLGDGVMTLHKPILTLELGEALQRLCANPLPN